MTFKLLQSGLTNVVMVPDVPFNQFREDGLVVRVDRAHEPNPYLSPELLRTSFVSTVAYHVGHARLREVGHLVFNHIPEASPESGMILAFQIIPAILDLFLQERPVQNGSEKTKIRPKYRS